MNKHTDSSKIAEFINTFAKYFNEKVPPKTYIILNDVNLGIDYEGGREYFDRLCSRLDNISYRKGRFCNDNAKGYYRRGYPYGNDSDGEFPKNTNYFDIASLQQYSPFDTCASAQMLIYKRR